MGGDCLSVPILYEANATDFNNLGLGPLVDTTVATVTEERNGQFILEMQYPVDGIRASLIAKNRILKVDAGHKLKDQCFVIKRINRIMGNDGLSYSIYAEHISYITADYALKPNLTVSGSGNVAMTQWLNGIIDSNRIQVDSDITTENTTSWTIDKVQNARQALGGVQGSILDVWGGEYRFDNLNISLLRHRGTVSNTMLSYGRNITDFDQEENITNTYTSIYPFASYSVQNGDTSEQKILTIPDLVVDSEYVNNFPNRKIQVVDFSDKFSTDEKPTVERLAELAKSYIKNNNVGVPTVSTKISFVDLSKTENYKEFAPLEELDLCDEVPFAFDKFGIKTTAKVSRIVWNVLLDSYDSLELGELKTNLSDVINNTNNAALDAKDAANDAKNSADNAALSANGKNRNWYGADDPAFGHLSELREGDSWYMPNGEDTELYHWINGQWVFILSTKTANDAADAADKASKEAEEAKTQANKAVDGANDAVAKAGFANDTATQAKSDAAAAGQQAKDALTSAGTALTDAKKALTDSGSAMVDSAQARKDSATAIKDAADSLTSAKDALNKVGSLTTSVTSQFTTVNNELKSKVNQTDYDKLKGTVTSQQTDISQNANSIKLKADKSYADTINNSVVKNTSSVGLLNDQIALTVSKAELNNTLSSYATQTWTQSQIKSTADSINLSVSKVQSNLDNLAIGGRNYILKSGTCTVNMNTQTRMYLAESIGYFSEKSIALSCRIDFDNHIPGGKNRYGMETKVQGADGTTYYPNVWMTASAGESFHGTIHALFNMPKLSPTNDLHEFWLYNQSATPNSTVTKPKIEIGTRATDWTEAPEDNATVESVSKIEVDLSGVKTTVANKADQSQVTQLADQITSVVSTANGNSSQITQLSKDINLRVTADQVDASILADKTIKDTRDDNQPPSWYYANYPTQIVREFKNSNKIGISDSTYASLETNVPWKDPSGGQIKQMARTDKHTWQRFSTSESVWGAWAIVADTSNVISQINISPESILIAGQKVHITGQTSIDNAVIKDAMIANVTADKITAGTLNAANVNVINLNANNITTGTIKGANLSMNLNTGEVLFQKGSIKSSDGTFAVDIDNRIITSTDDSHNGIVLKHGELHFYKEINAGSGSAEFGRMDVAYLNGGGLNITGYNGLTLGTEFTGLYEAHLALVSPKYNLGKSSAALVGDVIYLQSSLGKAEIIISGKTDISGSTSVIGDFDVLGKKNAIHLTNDGIRETPAYETAESYLGDIGEGVTDESGRALIHIDALFNQIINTDYDYQVFVSSYSNAIVWVEEREKASFEIHSNISNAKFAWEIKAKRRGYETDRLVKSEMKYERLNKFHEKKVSA